MTPDRMAFVASAQGVDGEGVPVSAVVLCWPTVPQAWVEVGYCLRAMLVERGRMLPGIPLPARASWLRDCAPQLAAPFQRTALAEETSVAALLSRAAMRVAVTVVGVGPNRVAAPSSRAMPLEGCLTTFDREASSASKRDCAFVVSAAQPESIRAEYLDSLELARSRMPGSSLLRDLQLTFLPSGTEPLPTELANVVATSVLRHLQSHGDTDAVFDAARSKFANDPFPRGWGKTRLKRATR
ncbi:hypothetical protein ABU614_07100 [Lysobacter firmicutimachus]|uniref:Uncharacterized protein n=1 Tax=Lysobacter firmicutimachus TaxID=1792846 RepID=A0AAU8MWG2_9GAMM